MPPPTELHKVIESDRRISVLKKYKLGVGVLTTGGVLAPFLIPLCRDSAGYINVPLLATLIAVVIGLPLLYVIFLIVKQ